MPDKTLTDSEIVKALECCTKREHQCCNDGECPLFYKTATYSECRWKLLKGTTDLINRLQAENERLSTLAELGNTRANDYRVMRDRALKAEAENEDYKALYEGLKAEHLEIIKAIKHTKAEAYKECIEKVMSKSKYNPSGMFYIVPEEWLKELVGE